MTNEPRVQEPLDERRYRDERRLRLLEYRLKRDEFRIKLREIDKNTKGIPISPTVATVLVALVTLASGAIGAVISNSTTRDVETAKSEAALAIEKTKVEGTLALEREKQKSAQSLAGKQFSTTLILNSIEGVSRDEAIRNLQFFLEAGFIEDPGGKIAQLSPESYPSRRTVSMQETSGISLRDPRFCEQILALGFKGAAVPSTDSDLENAAELLKIELPVLKAVVEVEGTVEFTEGRPTMIFDKRTFSRLTLKKFDDVILKTSSETQDNKQMTSDMSVIYNAISLDCAAGLASISWGKFQMSGLMYKLLGFSNIDDFALAQMTSGRSQILALVNFIVSNGLVPSLQSKDWHEFSRRYNGPAYRKFGYAERLQEAYLRAAKEKG